MEPSSLSRGVPPELGGGIEGATNLDGYTAYEERAITRAYVTRGHVAGLRSNGHRLRQQATFRGRVLFSRIIMASGVGDDVIPTLT